MPEVALVDGAGYFVTFDDGAWHEVQDPSLLAGYGLSTDGATEYPSTDYVQPVVDVLGPAAPPPSPPPPPPPPVPYTPPPATPQPTGGTVAGTNQPAQSFQWGGLTWTSGQLTAFIGYLAAHGTSYSTWAANHPDADAIFNTDTYPGGNEPVPKSVGEAIGTAIANGATPAEAAAQAAPLAKAQAAQGFGAPAPDQLEQAAQDVYNAYAASGGLPGQGATGGAGVTTPDGSADADAARQLQGINPNNLFGPASAPAGVTTSWKALVGFFKTTVPGSPGDVTSVINQTKAMLQ